LKVTFLGTGTSQGVPVIGCRCAACLSGDPRDQRLRSSVLVEQEDLVIVIDTGPDFRQQMLRAGVKVLNALLYSHEHRDHVAGLDDIRAFNFLQKRPMDVYAEKHVIRALNRMFPYVFEKKSYPGSPRVVIHRIGTDPFRIGPLEVRPVRMMHYRLPVLGFRIGDFAYLTDGSYLPDREKEKLTGLKFLAVNALRKEEHISHFTISQAEELIGELKPAEAWLTHISHQVGPVASLEKELPQGIRVAYDGLVLEV
jgi:phosphoribosyl 1,2-cyclic phosphate phosphodiesterase